MKYPIGIASAAIGLALLAGAARRARADTQIPPDGAQCYYHLWTCSYDGTGYWSGCDPNFSEGWITTRTAEAICTDYHSS